MSKEMKEYLSQVVPKHGFETRMAVPCGNCGENIDLGTTYIVPKEDIENGRDFEQFRCYRQLTERGSHAYKRSSRQSLSSKLKDKKTKNSKSSLFYRPSLDISNLDTRTFIEKFRAFLKNRQSYSLYIFPPHSRYDRQ